MANKQQLRQKYLDLLRSQPADKRVKKSRIIIQRLCDSAEYKRANTIFTYNAMAEEVDTSILIGQGLRDGKTMVTPRLEGNAIIPKKVVGTNSFVPGQYGILEPKADAETIDVADLDLIVVPGLAFTSAGVRLGRGGGHFDRWLATLPPGIPTIALAFDFQIASELPQEPHDITVSSVISA